MKRICFQYIICAIMFCGCGVQPNKNKEENSESSQYSKYMDAYRKASRSEIIIDTIFLGLRFGMNEAEVNDHLQKMVHKGKLIINDFGEYRYTLSLNSHKSINTSLSVSFFDDELYRLTLNMEEYKIGSTVIKITDKHVVNEAKLAFIRKNQMKKEKFDPYYYVLDGLGGFSCYINKNMIVEFSPLGSMSYINTPVEVKREEYKNRKAKESMSDL